MSVAKLEIPFGSDQAAKISFRGLSPQVDSPNWNGSLTLQAQARGNYLRFQTTDTFAVMIAGGIDDRYDVAIWDLRVVRDWQEHFWKRLEDQQYPLAADRRRVVAEGEYGRLVCVMLKLTRKPWKQVESHFLHFELDGRRLDSIITTERVTHYDAYSRCWPTEGDSIWHSSDWFERLIEEKKIALEATPSGWETELFHSEEYPIASLYWNATLVLKQDLQSLHLDIKESFSG